MNKHSTPTWLSGKNVGTPGKGLKLEETWQPPPDWIVNDASEGSDASASPEGPGQMYPSFDHDVNMTQPQYPRHYPADFSAQSFYFDNDDLFDVDWVPEDLKLPHTQTDQYSGYAWPDQKAQPSYI